MPKQGESLKAFFFVLCVFFLVQRIVIGHFLLARMFKAFFLVFLQAFRVFRSGLIWINVDESG